MSGYHWTAKDVRVLLEAYQHCEPALRSYQFWRNVAEYVSIVTGTKRTGLACQRKGKESGLDDKLLAKDLPCMECGKPQGRRSGSGLCVKCYSRKAAR